MDEIKNTVNSGDSLVQAESMLQKFLKNTDYRVLAVKGKWGVGKTHLVRNFLDKHHKNYYLYASVFGISSIEHLKARIVGNYQQNLKFKPIKDFIESLNRNYSKLEKTPKLDFGLSGSLLAVGGDLLLEIFFNLNLNSNSIICIDDLERNSDLPLNKILGFVEYLVQTFECKIILIYNEDELEQESQNALEKYREKVIDKELNFAPTVEENLDFIFKDSSDLDIIKEVFKKTGTNNIRVIKKTKWLIRDLIPLMEDWESSFRHQIIRNIIVISVATLDTDFCKRLSIDGIDPVDTIILSRVYNPQYQTKYQQEDEKTSIKKLQLMQKVEEMGYRHLEKLDELISKLVNSLLSDSTESDFREKGHLLNQREKRNKILKKLDELANNLYKFKYYNSFADNEQDIINGIITFLQENHLQLSILQFEQIERLTSILGLDISEYEKPLLEKILTEIFEQDFYENLISLRNKLSKYPDLEASLNEKIKEYHQTLDITRVVKNIINPDDSSMPSRIKQDIEFLRNITVDEYCQWLKKDDPDLYRMVGWVLNSGYQPAPKNLEQAIRKLAESSNINRIRAKFLYEIDIDSHHTGDTTN
ncbi:MAG TPA: P-loop NTPase fold protein [Leptolyngbyaceae cyanobacterium]